MALVGESQVTTSTLRRRGSPVGCTVLGGLSPASLLYNRNSPESCLRFPVGDKKLSTRSSRKLLRSRFRGRVRRRKITNGSQSQPLPTEG